jgi:hypothetical protein
VLMLAASFIVFIAVGSAKSVQTSGHQLPTTVLMDGTGPMCFPGVGCGYKPGVLTWRSYFPAAILLTDGGGPMCFPGIGCGYRDRTLPNANFFSADILLADGGGPMCFPGIGCGRNVGLVYRSSVSKP